jgi:hypothetical protein
MKKLFIGLFVLLGLFTLAACNQETKVESPSINEGEFDQNEETFIPDIQMYAIGSHWNNWDTASIKEANPSCAFVKDENSAGLDTKYTYTVTVTEEMAAGWVGFKFIDSNSWSVQYGMEDVDFSRCNEAFLNLIGDQNEDGKVDNEDKVAKFSKPTSDRSNIEVTAVGTYVIEYYPYNFESSKTDVTSYSCKFVVTFTPAA